MSNPFGAKPLPGALKLELDARRDINANKPWFASRSNWVSLTSMCEGCSKAYKSLGENPAYIDGSTLGGQRPNPIITNVKVKSMGTIGSTRVATITILAFNEDQLNEISKCFLRSNMSVRIEFGWTVAASSTIAPGPVGAGQSTTDTAANCAIYSQTQSNPCYDGLQGRVGKWKIGFNKDGRYWEIQIDIAAPSVPVLNLPAENFKATCKCEVKQQNAEGENEVAKIESSMFRSAIRELIRMGSEGGGDVQTYISRVDPAAKAYAIHLNGAMRDENGNQPGWFDSATSFASKLASYVPFNTEESDETFITLETFFKMIQKLSLTQKAGSDGSIYCTFDLSSVSQGVLPQGGVVHSSDPHICLIPGADTVGGTESGAGAVAVGLLTLNPFITAAYVSSMNEGYKGIDGAASCVGEGVDIGKILVNTIFINKCFNELGKNIKIQDLVDKVLSGINESVGNLWELTIVEDTDCAKSPDVPNIVVIDLNNSKQQAPYEVKVTAMEDGRRIPALVRDISMELQLSSAMQAQALYADTRTEATEDKCDQVRFKREQQNGKNLASPEVGGGAPTNMCGPKCEQNTTTTDVLGELKEAFNQLRDEITTSHKSNLYAKLVQYYESGAETGQCKNVLLPFEVSLTFDGIGGFSYAQLITVDALPEKYKSSYMYQIVGVEHDVTYGDWTTTIKSKPRYIS